MRLADFWDTAEQISTEIVIGGQDNQSFKNLMKYPVFKELMALNSKLSLQLSKWAYEDPNASFQPIESCSVRYLLEKNKGRKDPFNTILTQSQFLKRLPEEFKTGTVERAIPNYPIGLRKASSRAYFDYVLQKLHSFHKQGLIPNWSYFAQTLQ